MKKYSVKIANHQTSISLEEEFWSLLQDIAEKKGVSINKLVTEVDARKQTDNLSSALRLYILKDLQKQISAQ